MSANNNLCRNTRSMYLLVEPHKDTRNQHILFPFWLEKDYGHIFFTRHWHLNEQTCIFQHNTLYKVDFLKGKNKPDASVVVTQFVTLLVNWQDVSNNRLKNQPTTPSPVHISTSAPASAHCKTFWSFNKKFKMPPKTMFLHGTEPNYNVSSSLSTPSHSCTCRRFCLSKRPLAACGIWQQSRLSGRISLWMIHFSLTASINYCVLLHFLLEGISVHPPSDVISAASCRADPPGANYPIHG